MQFGMAACGIASCFSAKLSVWVLMQVCHGSAFESSACSWMNGHRFGGGVNGSSSVEGDSALNMLADRSRTVFKGTSTSAYGQELTS